MVRINKKLCSTDEVMQHANQEPQVFFPFGRVLDVSIVFLFPMCSHQVFNDSPSEFPRMSQISPNFNSMGQRGNSPFFNTNFYFGKPPKFQGFFFVWVMGQSKWIIANQK
jgi:hypothetical protein